MITPHLTEGRRVPHRHVAQVVQSVVTKYSGTCHRIVNVVEVLSCSLADLAGLLLYLFVYPGLEMVNVKPVWDFE